MGTLLRLQQTLCALASIGESKANAANIAKNSFEKKNKFTFYFGPQKQKLNNI